MTVHLDSCICVGNLVCCAGNLVHVLKLWKLGVSHTGNLPLRGCFLFYFLNYIGGVLLSCVRSG